MSEALVQRPARGSLTGRERLLAAKFGLIITAIAIGMEAYAAYGDPHQKSDQTSAVPPVAVMLVVLGAVVFGVLAPKALRAVTNRATSGPRWSLGLGIAAIVACGVFWSGAPLVVGSAAALVGSEGRRQALDGEAPTKRFTTGMTLGLIAAIGSLLMIVLGNTVLSS